MFAKEEKQQKQGIIESYIHSNKRVGVLLQLQCQTDFVARTEEFKALAHELCLQVAAMNPKKPADLLRQPWIKDASKTVGDLVGDYRKKLGEKVTISKFVRYTI